MDFVNENMHSDLVIEYAERFYNSSEHDGQQLPGVEIEETVDPDYRIKVTDVKIVDAEGEKVIGKPMGRYITVEAVHLPDGNDDYQQAVTGVLCRQLQKLLPDLKDKNFGGRYRKSGDHTGCPGASCCGTFIYYKASV